MTRRRTSEPDSDRTSVTDLRIGVPRRTPTYGTYGTDGESGCERTDPYVSDRAREQDKIRSLAYGTPCRYCGAEIYVALCRDGRWRSFDTATVPAAPSGVWAWRKTWGMEEQELIPGKRLHYCAQYRSPNLAPWDRR